MAWPERPDHLPTRLELAFGADPADPSTWAWTDISADLDLGQQIQIRRGRSNEAGQPSPSSAAPRLVNNSGDYTPGHPLGAYYPMVRQGVPARISVQAGGPYLRIPDAVGAVARAAAAPTISGDLDVRVEVALDRAGAQGDATIVGVVPGDPIATNLVGRYQPAGDLRSWRFYLGAFGNLFLTWSTDGTLPGVSERYSSEVIPYCSGQRFAARVTLDLNNGSGGHTLSFYVAPSLAGPWRQLGAPQIGAGITGIYNPAGVPLDIGDVQPQLARPAGRWYRAEVRSGIDGTVVAAPNFTTLVPGATGFTDSAGIVWALSGGSEITDWRTRMVGTVDEWAPSWPWGDLSDPDRPEERPGEARVDITISGILRRLGQGQQPLQSTLRRRVPAQAATLAYWPLEDGARATSAASGLPDGPAATVSGLRFAANSELPSSAPLPTLEDGARVLARLPGLPDPSLGWRVEMVYYLDTLPTTNVGWIRVATTGGGIATLTGYIGGDRARITARDGEGATVAEGFWTDTTALAAATAGWCRVRIVAVPITGGWDYRLWWTPIGSNANWYTNTASGSGPMPFTRPVTFDSVWPSPASMPIGHITYVNDPAVDVYGAGTGGPDDAYAGEYALARMRRLAQEERLPLSVLGNNAESAAMGPQGQATLLELVQECAAADGGILSERREAVGLQYRPAGRLYNQRPALELSARGNEITAPFAPTLDDQRLRNLIQVTRQDGSSAVAEDAASIAEHGLYDDSLTLNVATDDQLEPIANWRLYRGTWGGMRYPAVATNLDVAPQTITDWLDRGEGDRITVGDLPPQHPTDAVDLLVEGTTETITPTRWSIEANASPGGVWTVGEVGGTTPPGESDAPQHVDTDGTELYAGAGPADTRLIVRPTAGREWATTHGPVVTGAATDLPVDIRAGGEVMTLGAVEPMMWDSWQRTVSGGWGTTPSAIVPTPSWSLSGGSASDRSVAAGQGRVTLPDTVPRIQFLTAWTVPDVEQLVTVTVPAVATGASLRAGILMRISGSDYYELRADLATGGAVGIEATRTGVSLTGVIPTGATYGTGTQLRIRARVDGQRVRGRVWLASRTEPATWQVDYTVTSGTIATGALGLAAARASGNTNASPQFAWSGYQTVTPQLMTVVRAVNGISKSHSSGADLRLAQPMIVAL